MRSRMRYLAVIIVSALLLNCILPVAANFGMQSAGAAPGDGEGTIYLSQTNHEGYDNTNNSENSIIAFDICICAVRNTPTEVMLDVYAPGCDELNFEVLKEPTSGTVSGVVYGKVTYTPDKDYVGNDSFTYKASDGENESNEATVWITVAYEPPRLEFESVAYSVYENDGYANITVIRTGCPCAVVSAVYGTSEGSAAAGEDYTETSGVIVFGVGETKKTFDVPIKDDSAYEGNETVNLQLDNISEDNVLGELSRAVLTIMDNERRSSGGGGGGGTENPPAGAIIDRMPDYIALSKPVKIDQVKGEIILDYNSSDAKAHSRHSVRVYYWNVSAKKWVALASYPVSEGRVKAVNSGGYKGWFTVFGVIQPAFADVEGHWAEQVINRMNGLGLVEGYYCGGDDMIRMAKPEQNVTRAEFTTFLYRTLNINPDKNILPVLERNKANSVLKDRFSDYNKIVDWSICPVAGATLANLANGKGGAFDPESPITRIEAAIMVSRAMMAYAGGKAADLSKFKDAENIPDWAQGKIAEGVLLGYPDNTLRPNIHISRAEALTLLHRLFVNGMGW